MRDFSGSMRIVEGTQFIMLIMLVKIVKHSPVIVMLLVILLVMHRRLLERRQHQNRGEAIAYLPKLTASDRACSDVFRGASPRRVHLVALPCH